MNNPTSTSEWLPIIDVSKHQGNIDFTVMRSKGIPGLILRATNGTMQDSKVVEYYRDARAAGYSKQDIGFYSFINPKRGSGYVTAQATYDFIKTFREDMENVLYMIDVENFTDEYPNPGSQNMNGAVFAAYLREHMRAFTDLAPNSYIMAYSNSAYWDGPLGPRDPALAAELDWIVPRYPAYSLDAYARNPLPSDPAQWDEWAWNIKPAGPINPQGSTWQGWQFSAGYNRQGADYGCQSGDLDLNIVEKSAWQRWTNTAPVTTIPEATIPFGDEMKNLVVHDGVRLYDSRQHGAVGPKKAVKIQPAGKTPEGADVMVNLTIINPEADGFVTVWSGNGTVPGVSQANYSPKDTSATNGFTVTPVADDGTFSVYSLAKIGLIVDQVAYVEDAPDPTVDIDIDMVINTAVTAAIDATEAHTEGLVEEAVAAVVERLSNG